jgi:hypothetical protein
MNIKVDKHVPIEASVNATSGACNKKYEKLAKLLQIPNNITAWIKFLILII